MDRQIKARAEMKPAERLHAELLDLKRSDPSGYQRPRRLLTDA